MPARTEEGDIVLCGVSDDALEPVLLENEEVRIHGENEAGVDTVQAFLQRPGMMQAASVARYCPLHTVDDGEAAFAADGLAAQLVIRDEPAIRRTDVQGLR